MGKFVKVGAVSELSDGQAKTIEVEGHSIALFKVGGAFYAIDNTCSHVGGPLADGTVEGEEVECPWHGARFNVKTGAAVTPPAGGDVAAYPVRVSGSDIEVEV